MVQITILLQPAHIAKGAIMTEPKKRELVHVLMDLVHTKELMDATLEALEATNFDGIRAMKLQAKLTVYGADITRLSLEATLVEIDGLRKTIGDQMEEIAQLKDDVRHLKKADARDLMHKVTEN